MSAARRFPRMILSALIVLPLGFALAGCETFDKLNPFAEKQTPLPGVRKPLFPEGVPGVEFGAPPPQPSNSNIPISPAIGQSGDSSAPAQAEQQPPQTQARAAQPVPPASTKKPAAKAKTADPDDAWAGTR